MLLNGVLIADNFAEAFGMRATRLVITADTIAWARRAAESLTGFAPRSSAAAARPGSSGNCPRPRRPMGGRASPC